MAMENPMDQLGVFEFPLKCLLMAKGRKRNAKAGRS